jgi:hypothetical protein
MSGAGTGPLQAEILIDPGLEAVGGVISLTVINWLAVPVNPHGSVYVHVLVRVAGHEPTSGESDPFTIPPVPQLLV